MSDELKPFGTLLEYPLRSGVTVPKDSRGSGIRMVNMRELFGYPRLGDVVMSRVQIDVTDEERFLLREGDLLFARRSLTAEGAGKCSILISVPERTTWESSIIRARLARQYSSPEFYYYYFCSEAGRRSVETIVEQVAAAGIRSSDLARLMVPAPSLAKQHAIVSILRALDDKVSVNDRIVSNALALGDTCFSGVEVSTARRAMLAELTAEKTLIFGDGYRTKRSEHGRPGLPILRAAEVMDGRIEPEFADFVADRYRSAMGGKVSQAGDVILTTKGTVGRVAAIKDKDPSFVYSPQLCYFRVLTGSELSSSYVYFWLRSSDFWRQAESRKSQTDMADYLSLTDIRKLTIPMPASGSDRQPSPTLSSLLAKVSACHEENRALANLRDTLLPKLMSGEIRVRDAEKVVEDVT